ncbi:Protein of unknown function [Gryllus bimaculatus]|nr:Protein of unknown function [Gryllus bimaculatus]
MCMRKWGIERFLQEGASLTAMRTQYVSSPPFWKFVSFAARHQAEEQAPVTSQSGDSFASQRKTFPHR